MVQGLPCPGRTNRKFEALFQADRRLARSLAMANIFFKTSGRAEHSPLPGSSNG
jgi:hypothetical protein